MAQYSQRVVPHALRSYSTLIINLIGSFLIGFVLTFIGERTTHQVGYRFLVIGFLGGLTNYSTFSLDAFSLAKGQEWLAFISYISLHILCGICCVTLGFLVGQGFLNKKTATQRLTVAPIFANVLKNLFTIRYIMVCFLKQT